MKKFLIAMLMSLLVSTNVNAEVETYEGVDEYYVLGAVENINVARERARERALRAAREKAGVYIHSFSRTKDYELVENEIVSIASGILRVIETAYEVVPLNDKKDYIIRAKVKADIDTSNLEEFLQKDAEEMSKIVANETVIREQEKQQEEKIETLKQNYITATTTEEKGVIAQQIVEEDKIFLSNLKLREGNKLSEEGNYTQAEKLFSEAIELDSENFLAWHNHGWACVEQRKYKQAMTDFNKAAELNPASELPYFGRGWVYNLLKEYNAAIKEYDKVIEINPTYAIAWNNRGAAKSWLNKMNEAIADYDKALELNPNYVKAYENRGNAFIALGNRNKSAVDFQKAAKINRSNKGADKFIEQVLAMNNRGEFIEALDILNKAAELYLDNQFIFVNRGNIYNDHLRDYEAAIADYNKALEINPKFSWAYHNRALAYGRLKRWDEAIADYGRALEIDKNYVSAYNGRAWSYCQMGKFEEALVDANKAVELNPNDANFLDTRAGAYIGLKRYEEALSDLNRAIKLSPEGWLYHNRGELYLLMGEQSKAQADFAKARKLGYNG
ncbi:MAG: tetratricopeptide repeat protein [Selenomonadaceae bacterium]|nr:tetratricopeptide repeat protein [Selenomonadaceae bacterium]